MTTPEAKGRLKIRLTHEASQRRAFSPLTPPRALHVEADPTLARGVVGFECAAALELTMGEHALALFPRESLRVRVPMGAVAKVSARARDGRLESASIVLEAPLVIPSILRVLAALPSLFEGRELAALRGSLAALRGLPGINVEALEEAGATFADFAATYLGELVAVELRSLELEAAREDGVDALRPRWSGDILVGEVLRIPFTRLHLPAAVLPSIHATLERLLSPSPLVHASMRREHLDLGALAGVLRGLARSASGSFSLEVSTPPVSVEALLPDRGTLHLDVTIPESLALRGELTAELTADGGVLRVPTLEIRAGEHAARATFEARLAPEGVSLSAVLAPGARLPDVRAHASIRHDHLQGGLDLVAVLGGASLGGEVRAAFAPKLTALDAHHVDLAFEAELALSEGSRFDDGLLRADLAGTTARLLGGLRLSTGAPAELSLSADARFRVLGGRRVDAFPELGIEAGELRLRCDGEAKLEGRIRADKEAREIVRLHFSGTSLVAKLRELVAEAGALHFALPEGSEVHAALREASLAATGLGHAKVDFAWDLCGLSPVLSHGDDRVEIFVPKLRAGALVVELSAAGGLSVTGERGGLYDARFFNALLHPGAEPERMLEILENDEAMEKVLAAVRLFNAELHKLLGDARALARRARAALDAEAIERPGDFIPGPKIARVLSRLLVGTTELEARVHPLVKQVTDGHGLDVHACKQLLDEVLGEHDYGYELDRGVRLLAMLLAPTEPVPPMSPEALPPLEALPVHRAVLQALPSAAEIYAAVDGAARLTLAQSESIARVSPYLSLEQVEYVLGRGRADFAAADLARIEVVRELKRRVRLIEESYGGVAFAPQAMAISFFLGESLALSEDERRRRPAKSGFPLADTLLGPEDLGVLLQAGLTSAMRGRTTQLNLRMLLDHALGHPPGYLLAVLLSLSGRSAEVLASALNALLNVEQTCLRAPLDLVAVLSARLGLELPRLSDYLAGGRYARLSYFEALHRAAEQLLAEAEPELAIRCHLQLARGQAPASYVPTAATLALEASAREAIVVADAARSPASYEEAFARCADLLRVVPEALDLPWLRAFWSRAYEAAIVRSVVRNAQEDVDDVRRWLGVRLGRYLPWDDEQALVDCVLEAVYREPEDRARLASDPMVRLLLDPPPGPYDFAIVSAMGVITEGARGRELETAYARLQERHGVRVVRADTATARSLEFNAKKIEEALGAVDGPWGYIGYSQGCANALAAESRLLTGTPAQQALAARLRSRNLLFSAFNGSGHGTCGEWKFLRAVIEAERFLKHYQAIFSAPAAGLALETLRLLLDSQPFVAGMLGSSSLSHDGVRFLHREGRWKAGVPTAHVRGIIERGTLPEALEWLAHVLSKEIESELHDTQVAVHEAVGHAVWVRNDEVDVLRRCDMGSLVQRTHHWSPLRHETAFITTERDRAESIYDTPKDRHVFPWVETCARFGVIARRKDAPPGP